MTGVWIETRILELRGKRVLLDVDLARVYEVTTGNLNLAVRRNSDNFPADFMFQLTREEAESLILQSARPKTRGGRRHRPFAFTREGVAMLSSVLRSKRAVRVNIEIMRAFVRAGAALRSYGEILAKIDGLERRFAGKFRIVFEAIRRLMAEPAGARRRIGFKAWRA